MEKKIVWTRSSRCDSAACVLFAKVDDNLVALGGTGQEGIIYLSPSEWMSFVDFVRTGASE
jgi:hypothetical protein